MKRSRMKTSLRFAVAVALAGVVSCDAPRPTGPQVTSVQLAKGGGGGGPKVNDTDPAWAEQDTTLDVRILGSGFDASAVAEFTLDGVATDSMRTNSTTFVSATELIVNITVDSAAITELYDAEVTLLSGPPGKKKGVGVDLFAVTEKGTGPPPDDQPIALSGFTGSIQSANGGPVTHGINGADANIRTHGQLWVATTELKGKNRSNTTRLCVDLSQILAVHSSGDLADFQAEAGSNLSDVCSYFTLHTRDEGVPGLYDQTPGSRILAGGKLVLKELAGSQSNNWEWRILFDTPISLDLPDRGQGLCVDRLAPDRWTIHNGCTSGSTTVDDVAGLWRFPGPTHVADVRFPFSLLVTAVNP